MVNDGVDCDGGLAGLAVADDEFALAATDGDHGIDRFDARLHGGVDALARDDVGGDALDGTAGGRLDRAFAVDRIAQGVDNATDERVANGDVGNAASGPDLVAFLDLLVGTEDDGADDLLFQVQGHAHDRIALRVGVGKLQQLPSQSAGEAVDAGDPIRGFDNRAHVCRDDARLEAFDLLANDGSDSLLGEQP